MRIDAFEQFFQRRFDIRGAGESAVRTRGDTPFQMERHPPPAADRGERPPRQGSLVRNVRMAPCRGQAGERVPGLERHLCRYRRGLRSDVVPIVLDLDEPTLLRCVLPVPFSPTSTFRPLEKRSSASTNAVKFLIFRDFGT